MNTTHPPVAMTIDQARCVVWPFRTRPNMRGRRIGDLLDAQQLNPDHLRWALQHSHNSGVQAACLALLQSMSTVQHQVEQPIEHLIVEPQRCEPRATCEASIPSTCPTCGSPTQPDWRWSSARRGRAWRCEQAGLKHYLLLRLQPVIEAAREREWIIPPAEGYAGVSVEAFRAGRIDDTRSLHYGYHPDYNH